MCVFDCRLACFIVPLPLLTSLDKKTYTLELNEEKHSWTSPALGINVDMLTFGTKGFPLILFPTSMGMHNENRDFKLVESIGWFIESGLIKVYCPDSIDKHSWYNTDADPADRVKNQMLYERMLLEEVYPAIKEQTGHHRIGVGGCSFGGYHACNFAFRNPSIVAAMFSLHAKFDIKTQLDGHYNDEVYFNNPVDYIAGLEDENIWKMQIFLGSAEFDMCLDSNYKMAQVLGLKQIPHTLEVLEGEKHDWPAWRQQLPRFLSMMDFDKIYK